MITLKINVNLIDKSRLFKGEKGVYLDLVLIETPEGKYGDFMVKQSQSKEDREAKKETPILGNAKYWNKPKPEAKQEDPFVNDDLPF
jgi:hypothetical protein